MATKKNPKAVTTKAAPAKKTAPAKAAPAKAVRRAPARKRAAALPPAPQAAAAAPRATPPPAPRAAPPPAPRAARRAPPLETITIEITGQVVADAAQRGLPSTFEGAAARSAATARAGTGTAAQARAAKQTNAFFIDERVHVVKAIELRTTARAAGAEPTQEQLDISPGQLVALEGDDGVVFFTSGARLRDIAQAKAPSSVRGNVVSLDALADATTRRSGQDTASRAGLIGSLASFAKRLLVLDVDEANDPAMSEAKAWLEQQGQSVPDGVEGWASYAGAKALSYVVEKRLLEKPGLYAVTDGEGKDALEPISREDLARAALDGPLLVLIHGTASNTLTSFGGLRSDRADWQALARHYGRDDDKNHRGRIFAFEHHTFSASPIENARHVLDLLPGNARVHLVTHSRGGLVGDLLCVDWANKAEVDALIKNYRRLVTKENEDAAEGFDRADAEDRRQLVEFAALARGRAIRVERYVRVAAPANGTLLMGRNLDLFLSVVLNLLQLASHAVAGPVASVPFFAAKRIVADIVRHRCNANVVPGLEPMLPLSPLTRLLAQAPVVQGLQLGIVAGDIEGTRLNLRRLVEFFTDWTFFDRHDHDLIVDTDSMDAGIARTGDAAAGGLAAVLFDQGPDVDHLSYFRRAKTRTATVSWLTTATPSSVGAFTPLHDPKARAEERSARAALRRSRRAGDGAKPIVVVLPGVMGTYLRDPNERLWTGFQQALRGCTLQLPWPDAKNIAPDGLFDDYYGELCEHLAATHRVERFAYDWRLAVQDNAQGLRKLLETLHAQRANQPLRILAHSMGGLVVRAMAAQDPTFWDRLLSIPGARVVMLGTPHQGSHTAAGMLIGRHDVLRKLAVAYNGNSLQEHVDLVATLPGALQLMPRREFLQQGVDPVADYLDPAFWQGLRTLPGQAPKVVDRLFGNGIVGVPTTKAVTKTRELFDLPGFDRDDPSMPGVDMHEDRLAGKHADKIVMVLGRADRTPIGLKEDDGAIHLAFTADGDGTVPWVSSRIRGIGRAYRVDAEHGNLCADERWFDAYLEILATGTTTRAQGEGWPEATTRGGRALPLVLGEPAPQTWPDDASILRAAMGAGRRGRALTQRKQAQGGDFTLKVSCWAMDLRDATSPLLVGHYEGDPIAGAQRTIDQDVVNGELTMRHHLGQYAGPVGTAAVVVIEPSQGERSCDTRRGAVVLGLGEFGSLNAGGVTQAVRAGCLRYLLACVDREGIPGDDAAAAAPPLKLKLASLLLGQNSTTNINIADSVRAIVRGVVEANLQFQRVRANARQALIVELQLVEWYLDVAISATKALRNVAQVISNDESEYRSVRVVPDPELHQSETMRLRLEAQEPLGYWPRLIVTGHVRGKSWKQVQDLRARDDDPRQAPIADELHFTYLSQRARAEAKVLHRQPGLVEKLAQLSIDKPGSTRDLGRTLFQLMTPLEFKDTARQMDALVLVVDAFTANFPWELMAADDEPLIRKTAVVRQFETLTWRQRVRPAMQMSAYVVGNPSTRGFEKVFTDYTAMPPLPGAEDEATIAAQALRNGGFEVEEAIGDGVDGIDVIHRLFKRPYRVLHIAAHGMFDLRPPGGGPEQARTGVVLSDGLFLTAAEIGQMELVPDLVFLNCCHIGKMDAQGTQPTTERNRLAASIARELIEMGVRAVIAAGWPVDDAAARHFATVFYDRFIARGRSFGEAIHQARGETVERFRDGNTWGAYQAYGDPSFVLDPQRLRTPSTGAKEPYVAPEELVDALERLTDALHRRSGRPRYDTLAKLDAAVEREMQRGKVWRERGNVLFAAAGVYAAFGDEGFAKAIDCYLRSVGGRSSDDRGYPSLRALEKLANFEARFNEQAGDEDGVMRAASRLERLVSTLDKDPRKRIDDDGVKPPSAELCGLIGRCWKGLAAKKLGQAQAEVQRESAAAAGANRRGVRRGAAAKKLARPSAKGSASAQAYDSAEKLLEQSLTWYKHGASNDTKDQKSRYCEINVLALTMLSGKTVNDAELEALQAASTAAFAKSGADDRVFEGFIPTDAQLLRELLAGKLGEKKTFAALVKRYRDEKAALGPTASEWGSLTKQIELIEQLTSWPRCPVAIAKQAQALNQLRTSIST